MIFPYFIRSYVCIAVETSRCRWSRRLRRRSVAARLVGLLVLILPGVWMFLV